MRLRPETSGETEPQRSTLKGGEREEDPEGTRREKERGRVRKGQRDRLREPAREPHTEPKDGGGDRDARTGEGRKETGRAG